MNPRYSRQEEVFGVKGQSRIEKSTVGIIGCGGLGTYVATELASAGIGRLVLIDGDSPDITNLNRQFVYRDGDQEKKAILLARWIKDLNPDVFVEPHPVFINDWNTDVLDDCEILVDCLDSVASRRVLNDYALKSGATVVHGGVSGMCGQVTVMVPGKTPCLECILKGDDGDNNPSVSSAVAFIASVQANEVLKIASGIGKTLEGKILVADLEMGEVEVTPVSKDPTCSACSHAEY
ncbi:MAG: HesA/MoeB/ThiF family protein [Candidatus Methanomethylophilaceae archaeon]|jgi:molybdopterin/thiamine biosynthesis adenylyltransferase